MADITSPSLEDYKIRERGLDWPGPMPEEFFAPMHGQWGVQQQQTMASMVNYVSRAHPMTFDEAVRDSRENALAMRRDDVVRAAMHHMQIPLAVLDSQIEARDENDQEQVEASAICSDILFKDFPKPGWQEWIRMQSESRFYGRYAVACKYSWDWSLGYRRLICTGFRPINGDKIVFTWGGQPGILVNAAEYVGPVIPTDRGVAHFLTPREQETIFITEFLPEDADFYESNMSGAIHGQGYRGLLYWVWWLRMNCTKFRTAWMRRASLGFMECFYDANDDTAKATAKQMIQDNTGQDVWLWPRTRDKESAWGIDFVQPSLDGAKFWLDIEQELNDRMRFMILGEQLTTGLGPTGLGEGTSKLHGQSADDRTKYHANGIGMTAQELLGVIHKYTFPGVPVGRYRPMVDKRDPEEYLVAVQAAVNMGLDVDADDMREVLSLPAPQPGKGILSKLQSLNPAAMAQTPQGVPVAGASGPSQPGQQPQQQLNQDGATDVNGEPNQGAIAYSRNGKRKPVRQDWPTARPKRFVDTGLGDK
jgi:hypothetical protein